MHSTQILFALVAASGAASAARCGLMGWHQTNGQLPTGKRDFYKRQSMVPTWADVKDSTSGGFKLWTDGEPKSISGNAIGIDGETLGKDKTGLAHDIRYTPTTDLFNIKSCKVEFNGQTTEGKQGPNASDNPCDKNGVHADWSTSVCSACNIEFEC